VAQEGIDEWKSPHRRYPARLAQLAEKGLKLVEVVFVHERDPRAIALGSLPAQASQAKPPPSITTCVIEPRLSTTADLLLSAPNAIPGTRLQQFGNQSRPSGLMGCAYAPACVAIKVFIEVDVIAKMGVMLQLRIKCIYLTLARGIL
jgi:hypothetical protein